MEMTCCCMEPGTIRTGMEGVLGCPNPENGSLVIERCDACARFHCDEAAALHYATAKGGTIRYVQDARTVIWMPS
jgi:hypothetical protein